MSKLKRVYGSSGRGGIEFEADNYEEDMTLFEALKIMNDDKDEEGDSSFSYYLNWFDGGKRTFEDETAITILENVNVVILDGEEDFIIIGSGEEYDKVVGMYLEMLYMYSDSNYKELIEKLEEYNINKLIT